MTQRNDRGQATRQFIVDAAARLFTEEGYAGASIERVLRDAGVSRGALYHHFSSKEALFAAVLEAVETRVAATLAAAAQGAANPLDGLRAGCAAWLELARDPTVKQVVLIDAPSVVGWQVWREIDGRHALGLLRAALGQAAEAGRVRPAMVDLYAHLLLAALIEVALLIARSEDATGSLSAGREAVELLLSALVGVEPHAAW